MGRGASRGRSRNVGICWGPRTAPSGTARAPPGPRSRGMSCYSNRRRGGAPLNLNPAAALSQVAGPSHPDPTPSKGGSHWHTSHRACSHLPSYAGHTEATKHCHDGGGQAPRTKQNQLEPEQTGTRTSAACFHGCHQPLAFYFERLSDTTHTGRL